jgi:CRP-like cAMP-binding protein
VCGGNLLEANSFKFFFNNLEKITGSAVPEIEKKKVLERSRIRRLSKKDIYLREGDISTEVAFTVSGLLRCFYIDKRGNDVTKYFCFEGSSISYNGYILTEPSKYYIEALEDCTLIAIDYLSFEALIKDNLFWLNAIKKIQDEILIYKEKRESSFLLENATERYINLIKNRPDIEERIIQSYLASYLGISPVSLSRIRNKLGKINICK